MPVYPTIQDATGAESLAFQQNWQLGPYYIGTNIYMVLVPTSGAGSLEMWKSTDAGATWTEVDAAHRPAVSTLQLASCIPSSATVFTVISVDSTSSHPIFNTFNTATDLWGVNSIGGTMTFGRWSLGIVPNLGPNYTTGGTGLGGAVRSDGSIVAVWDGAENVAARSRCRSNFQVFAAGAWLANSVLCGLNGQTNDDASCTMIKGAADRIHVFFVEYNGKTLQTTCIKSDNSVVAAAQVVAGIFDPGANTNHCLQESVGQAAFDGTSEIAVPYKDTNGNPHVLTATSADNPVWTDTKLPGASVVQENPANAPGTQLMACVYSNAPGQLSMIWLDSGTNLVISSRTSGVWSNPTILTHIGAIGFQQTLYVGGAANGNILAAFYGAQLNNPVNFFLTAGPNPPATIPDRLNINPVSLPNFGLPGHSNCCLVCEQPGKTRFPIRRSKIQYASR